MIIISCVLGLIAVLLIAAICHLVDIADDLDDKEEELDKYSIHLDERANMLSRWEQDLINAEKRNEK